jgi:hypothetical protein
MTCWVWEWPRKHGTQHEWEFQRVGLEKAPISHDAGEANLAEAVSDRHTVHSSDHVAVNDDVVACDMAHVLVDDETLDPAIFSLSLMGANFTDYIREAHRTLKLDGQLHSSSVALASPAATAFRNSVTSRMQGTIKEWNQHGKRRAIRLRPGRCTREWPRRREVGTLLGHQCAKSPDPAAGSRPP